MDDCVEFTKSRTKDGYGRLGRNGKLYLAHRLAWIDVYGEIPNGMCVCHKCDNPSCINIEHLWLGTHADNMKDKVAKGRSGRGGGRKPGCGGLFGRAKLSEKDIPLIRERLLAGETTTVIARDYGVERHTISNIKTGKTWKHVS